MPAVDATRSGPSNGGLKSGCPVEVTHR